MGITLHHFFSGQEFVLLILKLWEYAMFSFHQVESFVHYMHKLLQQSTDLEFFPLKVYAHYQNLGNDNSLQFI